VQIDVIRWFGSIVKWWIESTGAVGCLYFCLLAQNVASWAYLATYGSSGLGGRHGFAILSTVSFLVSLMAALIVFSIFARTRTVVVRENEVTRRRVCVQADTVEAACILCGWSTALMVGGSASFLANEYLRVGNESRGSTLGFLAIIGWLLSMVIVACRMPRHNISIE